MRCGVRKIHTCAGRATALKLSGITITAEKILSTAGAVETARLRRSTFGRKAKTLGNWFYRNHAGNRQPTEFGWDDTIFF